MMAWSKGDGNWVGVGLGVVTERNISFWGRVREGVCKGTNDATCILALLAVTTEALLS